MYIGHFAAGFAAKAVDKRPSLGTYFIAAQLLDLLFPLFLLTGFEALSIEPGITRVSPLNLYKMPFTHSLAGALVLGLLFGAGYYFFKKNLKVSITLGLLVLSHWVLDFITHIPDLQIIPGFGYRVGLGLWNSVAATVIVEGGIFVIGIYFYFRNTLAVNLKGKIILWSLIFFLTITYVMSLFSPPPPSPDVVTWALFVQWILIAWGYWADKNRKAIE